MSDDRYGGDVLAGDWRRAGRPVVPEVDADPGLVVELPEPGGREGFVGAVLGVVKGVVELEDRRGARRSFPLGAGFLVEGRPVRLRAPRIATPTAGARTASGSRAAPEQRARVARAHRIWVEGRHDAELVEKVWGDDLRAEGVVVEYLEGVDHLADRLAEVRPGPERRIGVLVDHLVPGSKESRIAEAASGAHVLVVGHPYVDVWQSVRPERLGLQRWPEIPRSTEWKHGICEALGWPHADQADIARAWQRILGRVRSYTDLEPALLGRVEQLIDFTTAPE
ncbi:DUF3097 domain-containing protein [Pseudolysinimonas kribbensis]|uniref:DUF3097 domain-containing protein n=1 Tax=Pseudolysinimonas kribbensis TaxID=433641 RepID=A0ABQ6K024_9MICO|nr:DUF3097 domain-containing protein [Pseudolysinimonas kribbensis]GMA93943.1 hypothetical protein GCM10025881_07670 [Pseudolysinimonas kribbensis]